MDRVEGLTFDEAVWQAAACNFIIAAAYTVFHALVLASIVRTARYNWRIISRTQLSFAVLFLTTALSHLDLGIHAAVGIVIDADHFRSVPYLSIHVVKAISGVTSGILIFRMARRFLLESEQAAIIATQEVAPPSSESS